MKIGGLMGWGTQSECVHATASTVSGPFVEQSVLVGNECHGPVVVRDPAGEWLMFHIGSGNGSEPSSGFMHHAKAPEGPWVPAKTSPGSCGMPSAAFHPNGTLYVVCGNGRSIFRATRWDAN